MLFIHGVVLTCRANTYNRKNPKPGESKTFTSHRALVHDPASNRDPIRVDTGETELQPGHWYNIPVYVSLYSPEGRSPIIEYKSLKDSPPQLLEPQSGAK